MISLTDDYNKDDKQKEIDDFFAQFDKISNEFDRSTESSTNPPKSEGSYQFEEGNQATKQNDIPKDSDIKGVRKTRMERLSESKAQPPFASLGAALDTVKNKFSKENNDDSLNVEEPMTKNKKNSKKKKKYKLDRKQFSKFVLGLFIILGLLVGGSVIFVIATAPSIDPDKIYSMLNENSVLYDDSGEIVDSLASTDGVRTNVSYTDLPPDLVNAFVAIEDKTFWKHHGFNFVRILGAIKESVFEGGNISGTSTITQQLARNLYLAETKTDYSMVRKIREAYYAILLERNLSKEQIVEAYLNTIFLGYGSNGVEAASEAYFSKKVSDLNLAECAALATLPKAPNTYAFIKKYNNDQVEQDNANVLYRGTDLTYVYNDNFLDRQKLVLEFMKEQGKITDSQYTEALAYDFRNSIKPSEESLKNDDSSYFADYVIKQVINDLVTKQKLSKDEARQRVYSGGLRIYTTMNTKMQNIVEKEYSNNAIFPKVTNLKKDHAGNLIDSQRRVLLYNYNNHFDKQGNFVLSSDEYEMRSDGSLVLYKNNLLNFIKTEVQNQIDYSIQFKNMYTTENNIFYSIDSGIVQVPQQYKERDSNGNLVISKKFLEEKPDFFTNHGNSITINSNHFTLGQKIIQPQSAMVIYDYNNGGIKAMVGGRNVEGRLLFNRATEPRQPGSSMKPIGVYGPALQSSAEAVDGSGGSVRGKDPLYGKYWTAASVINDERMTYNGKVWPKNWYTGYRGLTRMRTAIEQSVNTCAVKVFNDVGVKNSVDFAKSLGITSIVESGQVNDLNASAMALGGMTHGVSPLEMVAAYGTFANEGTYVEPICYTKVTNKKGEVILEKSSAKTQVMDKGAAFILTDMMRTAVTAGIAGKASIGSQPVAGKTGTTTDNYDAWFVGYTPKYAAAVWIGNDINIELSQGSAAATAVWARVMKQVHAGLPTGSFVRPDNVVSAAIDADSGMLANGGNTINEYFIKGTQPTARDNIHVTKDVCFDSGYLATPYCPNHGEKAFVNKSSSSGSAPIYYCPLHNPDIEKYPVKPGEKTNPDYNPGQSTGGGINNGDGTSPPTDGDDQNKEEDVKPPSWINF